MVKQAEANALFLSIAAKDIDYLLNLVECLNILLRDIFEEKDLQVPANAYQRGEGGGRTDVVHSAEKKVMREDYLWARPVFQPILLDSPMNTSSPDEG